MSQDQLDQLNLGAGHDIREGFVNHDRIQHHNRIDIAHDLNDLPWPWEDNSFDVILARAVLEHLKLNLLESVGECWRIIRPGGKLVIKLPYWRSNISYIDPTHYWVFALESLHAFDPKTEYGEKYAFYMDRKWRIIKGPALNNAKSSIHCTMRAIK